MSLPCTCAGPDVGWPQHEPNCARVLGYDPEDAAERNDRNPSEQAERTDKDDG